MKIQRIKFFFVKNRIFFKMTVISVINLFQEAYGTYFYNPSPKACLTGNSDVSIYQTLLVAEVYSWCTKHRTNDAFLDLHMLYFT